MKRNYLYIAFCALGAIFSSCSDWFDISPKTDVKAEDFFETENGFESALAGTYLTLTSTESYGSNFTFGLLDRMVMFYDKLPDYELDWSVIYDYQTENNTFNTKGVLATMWGKAYNTIANANNLLSWIEKNGERVITTENKLNYLKGEALALRAFVHFDLLRGWGPMYRSDSTALSIPYRKVADASRQPLLPANQIVSNIMADLSEARQLLSYEKEISLNKEGSERRFRLNYYAVTALMARVCNYRGDKELAMAYAQEVIDDCGLVLMDNGRNSPALYEEVLFGINIYQMDTEYESMWSEGPDFNYHNYCALRKMETLFETNTVGNNDMRAKSGEGFLQYEETGKAICRKYIKNDNEIVPLIRLPEMYYILCECAPLGEAGSYINAVRQKRGYLRSNDYNFQSEAERIDALDLEYRKEFYAEGQYFYFLKLHERTTFLNCPIGSGMSKQQYVFPLPDAEREYGWTSDGSENTNDNQEA